MWPGRFEAENIHEIDITVKFLVIVNESPWGSDLALAANRFVGAALESGVEVTAVFFREDGVYNALQGENCDAGTPDLTEAWGVLGAQSGTRLLMCSSSRARRFRAQPSSGFIESGLTDMMELMMGCDRVISF